jgi:hypothetical protein
MAGVSVTYNNRFAEILMKRVEAIREDLCTQIGTGAGVADFADYREKVGYIRALTDLRGWCDEAETDLNKG